MRADTEAAALGESPEAVREGYVRALPSADVPAARGVFDDAVSAGLPVRSMSLDVLHGGQASGGSADRALRT